ncbi:MAG TPA: DUF4097 family beta strand repeat-containing protein [Treponemataceae bacterium]|nr:DUF4097 family beta strand repeat-containing protein [Treponemataceae bacterium]
MADNRGHRLVRGLWLICIGCVLIAVGLSLGGHWAAPHWWPFGDRGFRIEWGSRGSGPERIRDIPEKEGDLPQDISSLEVNLTFANLSIKSGSRAGYRATGFDADSLDISVSGTAVRVSDGKLGHSLNLEDDFTKPLIEITLPEGRKLDRCSVKLDAGAVTLESVSAADLSAESGAGSVKGIRLDADHARAKTGAGNLELTDCRFADAKVETGAGRIAIKADLGDDAEVSTGAGTVELSLPGTARDWRFEFTRGIGVVRIGDESYTGVGNGIAGNPSAEKRIKLQSGVGAVRVSFY